jgi:CHASE2 domain-containing sensor protein
MMADFQEWFLSLGANYGVNPWIFGAIYVGAIPFFLASIAWLVKRARAHRSTVVPAMCAGLCFVSAYLYLAIAGHNIPLWVWFFLAALVLYGAWSTIRDTRKKIAAAREQAGEQEAGE